MFRAPYWNKAHFLDLVDGRQSGRPAVMGQSF
jgi:hypothetical protein